MPRVLQGLGSPNPFTISDLTYVWILCDVYENDLSNVHLGEKADIRAECLSGQGVHRGHQQHRARSSIRISARPKCASKCAIRD